MHILHSNCLNWKFTAIITLHFHLQPQYIIDIGVIISVVIIFVVRATVNRRNQVEIEIR